MADDIVPVHLEDEPLVSSSNDRPPAVSDTFTSSQVSGIERAFNNAGSGGTMNESTFGRFIGQRDRALVKQLFTRFDTSGTGKLSTNDFVQGCAILLGKDDKAKSKMLFSMMDTKGTGSIDRQTVESAMSTSAKAYKLQFSDEMWNSMVDDVMNNGGDGNTITPDSFANFVQADKRMMRNTDVFKYANPQLKEALFPKDNTPKKVQQQDDDEESPLRRLMVQAHQNWPKVVILLLFVLINVALFCQAFARFFYAGWIDPTIPKWRVWGVPIARGFGAVLNFDCALILVPMWRITLTRTRRALPMLQKLISLDSAIVFHKIIAYTILVAALGHTLAHYINYSWTQTYLRNGLMSRPGLTGHIVFFSMGAMFLGTLPIFRRGNVHEIFHMTHYLWTISLCTLLLHGPWFWAYFVIPGGVYLVEYVIRFCFRFFRVEVVEGIQLPQGWEEDKSGRSALVIHVRLKKPRYITYKPGQYFFINSREISWYEWHPFSVTSSPLESEISFHIRRLGNWTAGFFDIFNKRGQHEQGKIYVRLDGPYGAPAEHAFEFEYVMLAATGIGVTPMVSILRHMFHGQVSGNGNAPVPFKRVCLYWMNREQHAVRWFVHLLKALEGLQQLKDRLELNVYLTALGASDGRHALLYRGMDLYYEKNNVDPISTMRTRLHKGRPRWNDIFSKNAEQHPGVTWGVFFTGPPMLAADLDEKCTEHSATSKCTFNFYKENF